MVRRTGRLVLTALIGVAFLALAGCGHMPLTSIVQLARIDVRTTDPALLRVAVKLPRTVRPRSMALRIAVEIAGSQDEEVADFVLREISDPNEVLALYHELDPDTHIFAYRLDPSEAARLGALRDDIKAKQAASGRRGGTLKISVRPDACRTRELPDRPIYATTYLRTAETGRYVPLARDLDLRELAARELAALPPC
jgi:hypothetical protein